MVPVASPLSNVLITCACQVWICNYLIEVLDRRQLVLFLLKHTNILFLGGYAWTRERDNDDLWYTTMQSQNDDS